MQEPIINDDRFDPLSQFLRRAKPKVHRALFDILVYGWGSIVAAVSLFIWKPCWFTYLIAFLISGRGIAVLSNLAHESGHGALLPDRRWNNWIGGWLCGYPPGSMALVSLGVHNAHHKYLGTEVDPDGHFHFEGDKATPGQFVRFYLRLLFGGQIWTSFILNGFLRRRQQSAQAGGYSVVQIASLRYPEVLHLVAVQLLIFFCYWAASGRWWLYFALWVLPIFTAGTVLGYLRGFVEHAWLDSDDPECAKERLVTITHPGWLERFFFCGLDFHYHAEHHLFPFVPHYYLFELHQILQGDERYRRRYVLRDSYFRFLRDYWCQICRNSKAIHA